MCEHSQHTKYVVRFQEESLLNLGVLHPSASRDAWDSVTSALPRWSSAGVRTSSRLSPFPSLSGSRAPCLSGAGSGSGKWGPAHGPPTTRCSRTLKLGRLWEDAGHSLARPGYGTKRALLGTPMGALRWAAVPWRRSSTYYARRGQLSQAWEDQQERQHCMAYRTPPHCAGPVALQRRKGGGGVAGKRWGRLQWKRGGPRWRAPLLSPSHPSCPPTQAC